MSLTKKEQNRIEAFTLRWKSGVFKDGDREYDQLSFHLLDERVKMSGYSDEDKSGIWSNEQSKRLAEPFTVRTSKGVKADGMYADIKGKVAGMKFCKVLYVCAYMPDPTLVKIELTGSSLAGWSKFAEGIDPYQTGTNFIGKSKPMKKGVVEYYEPIFETFQNKDMDVARDMDRKLQNYFSPTQEIVEESVEDDGLPF